MTATKKTTTPRKRKTGGRHTSSQGFLGDMEKYNTDRDGVEGAADNAREPGAE